jgi:hypothetical protein
MVTDMITSNLKVCCLFIFIRFQHTISSGQQLSCEMLHSKINCKTSIELTFYRPQLVYKVKNSLDKIFQSYSDYFYLKHSHSLHVVNGYYQCYQRQTLLSYFSTEVLYSCHENACQEAYCNYVLWRIMASLPLEVRDSTFITNREVF